MSEWRYIHASELGTGHVATGQPCQDHHAVRLIENGQDQPLLLLVTSDGAGSAAHSEEGSAAACQETLNWLQIRLSDGESFLEEIDGVALVRNLRTHLLNHAEDPERQYALRDLACTLNVAAVLPDRAWFLQVGDGATIIQSADSPMDVVFWPDNGEYANQTYFVTDVPDHHIHTQVVEQEINRISLMTDGLQTLALVLQQRAAHTPFFESMFRGVEALEGLNTNAQQQLQAGLAKFLNSPGVNARTSDDKTLILASRRATPAQPPAVPAQDTDASRDVTAVEEEISA